MVYNNEAVVAGVSEAGHAIYVPGVFSYEGIPHPSLFGDVIQSEEHFAAFNDAKQFTDPQREPNGIRASRNAELCTATATIFAGQNSFNQATTTPYSSYFLSQQPPAVSTSNNLNTHYATSPALNCPSAYPPVPDTNNYGIPALAPAIEVGYPLIVEAGPSSLNLQQNNIRTYTLKIAVKLGPQPSVISSHIQETSHTAGHLSEVSPTPHTKVPRQRVKQRVGVTRVSSSGPRAKPYDKRATSCSSCHDDKIVCLKESNNTCLRCRVRAIPCEWQQPGRA